MDLVAQLQGSQLFRDAPRVGIEAIVRAGNVISVAEGDRIIEEGRVPQLLCIVLRGEMEVLLPEPANRSAGKRLATLRSGDCFGEYGFIDRRPASATVKATRASEIFQVPIASFDSLIRTSVEFERAVYRNLLTVLVDRLRASNVLIDLIR